MKIIIVVIPMALLAFSCATIIKGSTEEIYFNTNPQGATVSINGHPFGKTPLVMELETSSSHVAEIEFAGYEKKTVMIIKKVSTGFVILDILSGVLPVVIDAVTGSWNTLSPSNISVVYQPDSTARTYYHDPRGHEIISKKIK